MYMYISFLSVCIDLRTHLLSLSPLSQVCMHVIQSVHTEMERMKEEWEVTVSKAPPPKPAEGAGQEAAGGKEAKSSDSYCFELLSMVTRLSQSDLGCEFLSKQDKLVQDLFALLHIATVRIQLQVMATCKVVCGTNWQNEITPFFGMKISNQS